MSQDYVSVEVEKIINNEEFSFPLNHAMASAWILGNLKGINLKVFDVKESTSLVDYYILASATNTTQASSMASQIVTQLKKHGAKFISKEGLNGSDWILLDTGDIIIHIFLETARDVYGLESLWTDAKNIEIPNSYYFSGEEVEAADMLSHSKGRDYL